MFQANKQLRIEWTDFVRKSTEKPFSGIMEIEI